MLRKPTTRCVSRALWRMPAPCRVARRLSSLPTFPGTARKLDDIVKLDAFTAEPPERVAAIWETYHSDKPAVSGASLNESEHQLILDRGAESPLFVFPVWRESEPGKKGHFMLLSQFDAKHSMFAMTFLDDYKRNPATALPWISVLLFGDLVESKQLGLMRAEADEKRLTTEETQRLLLLVRKYYGTDAYDRAWAFNHAERHFNLESYLESCP